MTPKQNDTSSTRSSEAEIELADLKQLIREYVASGAETFVGRQIRARLAEAAAR